jgi:hypothetical protein
MTAAPQPATPGFCSFPPDLIYFASAGANPDLLKVEIKICRAMKAESGSVYYKTLVHWMEEPPRGIVPRYFIWIISGTAASSFWLWY